jgi:uroporphyrinogen-III synthase
VTTCAQGPVVITRPLAQATLFAQQVRAIGRQPVVFPLLTIAALEDCSALQAALARLADYALVVFVSPNAIDAVFGQFAQRQWPAEVAIGIVGEGSRLALQRHGVDAGNAQILAPGSHQRMDSEALFAVLNLAQLRGKRVLIVRGQAGRDFLTEMLRAEQIEVDHVTAYQRLAPQPDAQMLAQLSQLLAMESVWVITSSEALRNLLTLATTALDAESVVKLQRQRILVSHQRIAETAQSLGFYSVVVCGSGDERLIAALQSAP